MGGAISALVQSTIGDNTMDTFTITEGQWKGEKVYIDNDKDCFRAEFKNYIAFGSSWRNAVLNCLSNFDLQHLITKYTKPLKN